MIGGLPTLTTKHKYRVTPHTPNEFEFHTPNELKLARPHIIPINLGYASYSLSYKQEIFMGVGE